jgi:hypothetical protein
MKNVIAEYEGLEVAFTEDGWFHANPAAEKFGRRVRDFLALASTKEYIQALDDNAGILNAKKAGIWSKTCRGQHGGTWLHPKLAVAFARWLDVRFSVWCDRQIDGLLRGTHPHHDWKKIRHEAASSFKVMNAILQLTRMQNGKETLAHHFMNEARLINWALFGTFKSVDRDGLSSAELDLLADLEERNSVLLGIGMDRTMRKIVLEDYANKYKTEALKKLEDLSHG